MAGSEFQSLEVIGIQILAKALIRFLYNLTPTGRNKAFGDLSGRKIDSGSDDKAKFE